MRSLCRCYTWVKRCLQRGGPIVAPNGASATRLETVAATRSRPDLALREGLRRRFDLHEGLVSFDFFADAPLPFRSQNGGAYLGGHVLADDVTPEKTGLTAHIAPE